VARVVFDTVLDSLRWLLAKSAVPSKAKSCEAGAVVMSHKAVWSL